MTISSGPSGSLAHGPVATVHSSSYEGKPVALKVYPTKFDRKTLAAVEREQDTLRELASTAPILPVDGIEKLDDGRHTLRMELCAQSLTTLVQQVDTLPVNDVVVLGYALALALATAHNAGILHGGVSPGNVLLRASGAPVLADFGVPLREAFPRDPLYAIEYVSPETLRTGIIDERTDLYGLGAVLHFALTGYTPHPGQLGEQPGERVLRVLRSPVPAINRADVPVALSTVVARLLAPEAAHRPPDAAWVVEQLAGMLPTHDHTPPAANAADDDEFDDFDAAPAQPDLDTHDAHPTTGLSRRRYFLAGGAIVATMVVAALLFLFTQNNSDQLRTTPRQPPPPASGAPTSGVTSAVQLDLADPVDLGNSVELTWTSDRVLDYAVIVAGDGEPNHTLLAQRNRTMTVPVDPVRKYCFLIQATDGDQVYQTGPKAIRGATCHQ